MQWIVRFVMLVVLCSPGEGFSQRRTQDVPGQRTLNVRGRPSDGGPRELGLFVVETDELGLAHNASCAPEHQGEWVCGGISTRANVLAVVEGVGDLDWALAPATSAPFQTTELRRSTWGRIVQLIGEGRGGTEELGVRAWREKPSSMRERSTRVQLVQDTATLVDQLDPHVLWVSGVGSLEDRLIEVTGPGIATQRVLLTDILAGPPLLPFYVRVTPAMTIHGSVVSSRGKEASGAIVSVSELIDPPKRRPPRNAETETVKKRWVSELVTDGDGAFVLDGVGLGRYEFVVVHVSLGRVKTVRVVDGRPLTLRLETARRVRGRVLVDNQPATGVSVRVVPDLAAYRDALDPIDVVAPAAVSDMNGRFDLVLPSRGRGEVLFGLAGAANRRWPFGDVERLPPVTDLGDVALPSPVIVRVYLTGGPCDLRAAGPIGTLGTTMVTAIREPPGPLYRFELPEAGFWWLDATCDDRPAELHPPVLQIDQNGTPQLVEVIATPASP